MANAFQISLLNKLLPQGFRFELAEVVKKNQEYLPKSLKRKKTVVYLNKE
jgi:hypothetical protein